mgnify:FL=1
MLNADKIFNVDDKNFEQIAFEVFQFQYINNNIYKSYCDLLKKTPSNIGDISGIPFLPISFFKSHSVMCTKKYDKVFHSSGTTNENLSKHYVSDINIYEQSFLKNFIDNYGDPKDYVILGLLPNYMENENSSLIYMVNNLIELSESNDSGFFLKEYDFIIEKMKSLARENKKIILIGVSYALLDLTESKNLNFENTIIIETGGMKGRRREMIKKELHETLKERTGLKKIHSEYGMTELLSQAYSKGDGIFSCPNWMRVFIRDINDPNFLYSNNKSGGINIIDLANINSCSFIATEDMGSLHKNGNFEIMGRIDHTDTRGCNLLV